MLRFMIYDSESKTVPLAKDMKFISDFTRLMSLRLNSSVRLSCELPEICDNSLHIAPLLILTLVENAFKHVAIVDGKGFINVKIEITEKWLYCKADNSCINEENPYLEKGASGVGLRNIEKQLNLLYPHAYQLYIDKKEGIFNAELSIMISALRVSNGCP